MGQDCKLYVVQKYGTEWYVEGALHLSRDYRLFEAMGDALKETPPQDFASLGHVYPMHTRDGWDGNEPVTRAAVLKPIELQPTTHRLNKAAWAYLRELPDETPIIVVWC